jgi:hypothetical protein
MDRDDGTYACQILPLQTVDSDKQNAIKPRQLPVYNLSGCTQCCRAGAGEAATFCWSRSLSRTKMERLRNTGCPGILIIQNLDPLHANTGTEYRY